MTNKEMIKKLKDTAELAWAAYGYYDLIDKLAFDFKSLKHRTYFCVSDEG